MPLAELLREAIRAMRAHALRSFLTLLGVIIGVATVVGVVAVISGLNGFVRERVIQLGPDMYVITKFGITRSREEFLAALKRRNIDWNDYLLLLRTLRLADEIVAEAVGQNAVKFGGRRLADVRVSGTTANYGGAVRLQVAAGRYFTRSEDDSGQALVVIGWDVRDELFGPLDPLGRSVLVGGSPYRVIGLVAKQGRVLGENRDNRVFLPIQAYRRQFGSRDSLNILLRARNGVSGLEASIDEARALLRAARHSSFKSPDPFGLITAENLQTLWRQISAAAFILTVLTASVSLAVGGIVITNIMLVAVVERTQEIGMRLAVGARKRDIRRQFLLEATLLSVVGGLLGVALGVLLAVGVRTILDFPAQATPAIALMGVSLSAIVGVAAGYWPARSASNLTPVDALRAE